MNKNGTDRGGREVAQAKGHRAGIERLFQHGAGDLETERQGTDPWLLAALKCVSVPPARRNPHTGSETIEIAAAKVPAFKPEKGLKDAIQ